MSPRSYVAAGFERAAEMGSGADAVLGYERWTDSRNPAELEAIARYNEEDCRATLALHDWLVAIRPATAARLAPVPQRALDAETFEAASAREALTTHEVVSAPATRSASIARGEVDAVILGADRICANFDVVNKVGSYAHALGARAAGIPRGGAPA